MKRIIIFTINAIIKFFKPIKSPLNNKIKSYNKVYSKEYYQANKEDKLNYSRDYYIKSKVARLSNDKVVKDLF